MVGLLIYKIIWIVIIRFNASFQMLSWDNLGLYFDLATWHEERVSRKTDVDTLKMLNFLILLVVIVD